MMSLFVRKNKKKFHQKLGFKQSGILEKFGFKFDKWIDTLLMQKEL